MEAVGPFETLVNTSNTTRPIHPEDRYLNPEVQKSAELLMTTYGKYLEISQFSV